MEVRFFLSSLLLVLFLSACSQKLPVPNTEKTGILIIPTTTSNNTQYPFGYHYTFLYQPETDTEIKVVPNSGYQFVLIDDFLPGQYEITGIKTISTPGRGFADISSAIQEFPRPYKLQVLPGTIKILDFMFVVKQSYSDPSSVERYSQGMNIKPLDNSQREQVINAVKQLSNAELWEFDGSFIPQEENVKTVSVKDQDLFEWAMKRAKAGIASSQVVVADCYNYGKGVEQDFEEAAVWYRKAAEQGNVDAMVGLGGMYDFGILKDKKEAIKWYRKAADHGHSDAKKM